MEEGPTEGSHLQGPPETEGKKKDTPSSTPENDQVSEEPACEALRVSSEQKCMVRDPQEACDWAASQRTCLSGSWQSSGHLIREAEAPRSGWRPEC